MNHRSSRAIDRLLLLWGIERGVRVGSPSRCRAWGLLLAAFMLAGWCQGADLPTASFATPATTVTEGWQDIDIPVVLDRASATAVTVRYSVAPGGTAGNGSDYRLDAGSLTFNAGETSKTIRASILDDNGTVEADESFTVRLDSVSPGTLGTQSTHTITIHDNDMPVVQWQQASTWDNEEVGSLVVQLQMDRPSPFPVSVDFTCAGTATFGEDYQVTRRALTIPPGQTNFPLRIFVGIDAVYDPGETIILTLGNPVNSVLGSQRVHTVTIQDNGNLKSDSPFKNLPALAWTTATQAVGEGVGTVTATATLGASVGYEVTAAYEVTGTATLGVGVQGLPARGILTIPANSRTASVSFQVVQDSVAEPNETVVLTLAEPAGARLDGQTAETITITDDDGTVLPTVAFAAATSTAAESAGTVSIPVALSAVATTPVTVAVTVGGTAGGDDVSGIPASVTIPAGSRTAAIPVTVINDTVHESDETVVLTLASPQGATLATPAVHTLTIVDDDLVPVSITMANLAVIYDGTPHGISASTSPSGIELITTYDGSSTEPTEPGVYTVKAVVARSGYIGEATATLTIQDAGISIVSPTDGSVVTTNPVNVRITSFAAGNATIDEIRINSVLAALRPASPFDGGLALDLEDGNQVITAEVRTSSGHAYQKSITVTVAARPLPITILSPADDASFGQEWIFVQAQVSSQTAVVTIGGAPAVKTGYLANAWVHLSPGSNAITAVVSEGGRTGEDSVTVTFQPPVGYDPANDSDGDGVPDGQDLFPNDPLEWQDSDGDGVGDNEDADPNDPLVTSVIILTDPVPGQVITSSY
jgi:hypothetical protein